MSFQELSRKLSPTIKRIAYKLNTCRSYFNEEDLYQEAMIRLWQDHSSGKLDDKTDSYILQGCYFHLKNYIRVARPKARLTSIEAIVNEDGQTIEETTYLRDKSSDDYFDRLNDRLLADTLHNNGFTQREKEILGCGWSATPTNHTPNPIPSSSSVKTVHSGYILLTRNDLCTIMITGNLHMSRWV